MKKSTAIFGAVAGASMLALLWEPLVGSFLNRDRNRGEVRALYERIHIGMKNADVASEINSGRYPHLHPNASPDSWTLWTPTEFGAQNWVLVVRLTGGQVVSVQVRTEDSFSARPPEAPPDKGTASPNSTVPSNKRMQLTKAARSAPLAFRLWGQSLKAAFAADPQC